MTKPPTSESSAAAGAVLLDDAMAKIAAEYPIAAIVRALDKAAPGFAARYLTPTPQPPPEAGSVEVPEGWQLVPKEPTEAMMAAAWNHTPLEMDDMTDGYFGQAYRDMLAAAPAPKESK